MKKIFTPEVLEQIPKMVARGMSSQEIADSIGCKKDSLVVVSSRHGISLRRPQHRYPNCAKPKRKPQIALLTETVRIDQGTLQGLTEHAAKHGFSGVELVSKLLETIVKDDLYDAVLDLVD